MRLALTLALVMPLMGQGVAKQPYRSVDGCNWCTDLGNGLSSCTAMACIKTEDAVKHGLVPSPTWADATGKATLGWEIRGPAPSGASTQIHAALSEWSKYIQVQFLECAPEITYGHFACDGTRTLTFSFVPADHGCGALGTLSDSVRAHAHWPAPVSVEPLAGDVHFLTTYNWTAAELYLIALHEIGHALGLQHGRDPWGVMYEYENGTLALQRSDIEAARRHYAKRCFEVECAWGVNK